MRTLGIEELGDALGGLPGRIGGAAEAALGLEGVVETARALCPVDSGALSASIRVERGEPLEASLVAGGTGYGGRTIDYAAAVHDGTSRRPGRPFLQQALLIESPALERAMLEGVEP